MKRKRIKIYLSLILLTFVTITCTKTKSDKIITEKSQHNVIDNKTLTIKDSLTAINTADPILYKIYGKENIIKQRPYRIHFVDSCWVLSGTLPKNSLGGTFQITLDARNSNVIRITHEK